MCEVTLVRPDVARLESRYPEALLLTQHYHCALAIGILISSTHF